MIKRIMVLGTVAIVVAAMGLVIAVPTFAQGQPDGWSPAPESKEAYCGSPAYGNAQAGPPGAICENDPEEEAPSDSLP